MTAFLCTSELLIADPMQSCVAVYAPLYVHHARGRGCRGSLYSGQMLSHLCHSANYCLTLFSPADTVDPGGKYCRHTMQLACACPDVWRARSRQDDAFCALTCSEMFWQDAHICVPAQKGRHAMLHTRQPRPFQKRAVAPNNADAARTLQAAAVRTPLTMPQQGSLAALHAKLSRGLSCDSAAPLSQNQTALWHRLLQDLQAHATVRIPVCNLTRQMPLQAGSRHGLQCAQEGLPRPRAHIISCTVPQGKHRPFCAHPARNSQRSQPPPHASSKRPAERTTIKHHTASASGHWQQSSALLWRRCGAHGPAPQQVTAPWRCLLPPLVPGWPRPRAPWSPAAWPLRRQS